jgi:hypothetical protein
MSAPLLGFLIVLALFNAFVSCVILARHRLSRSQKVAQVAIVWLLPAVGAIICMTMASTLDRREGTGTDGVGVSDPSGFDGGIVHAGGHDAPSCDFGGDSGGCDSGGGDGGGGGD